MSIIIPAKAICDTCHASVDITLDLHQDVVGVTEILIRDIPEGWFIVIPRYGRIRKTDNETRCPKHNYRKERK